jgi:hypothetical protein
MYDVYVRVRYYAKDVETMNSARNSSYASAILNHCINTELATPDLKTQKRRHHDVFYLIKVSVVWTRIRFKVLTPFAVKIRHRSTIHSFEVRFTLDVFLR